MRDGMRGGVGHGGEGEGRVGEKGGAGEADQIRRRGMSGLGRVGLGRRRRGEGAEEVGWAKRVASSAGGRTGLGFSPQIDRAKTGQASLLESAQRLCLSGREAGCLDRVSERDLGGQQGPNGHHGVHGATRVAGTSSFCSESVCGTLAARWSPVGTRYVVAVSPLGRSSASSRRPGLHWPAAKPCGGR